MKVMYDVNLNTPQENFNHTGERITNMLRLQITPVIQPSDVLDGYKTQKVHKPVEKEERLLLSGKLLGFVMAK